MNGFREEWQFLTKFGLFYEISHLHNEKMADKYAKEYGYPAREMTLIGVTGTKGKTSTTHLIKSILEAAGKKVGIIGTNGACYDDVVIDTGRTTPESVDLHPILRKMKTAGCEYVVMEVSSFSTVLGRVSGIQFDIGVFTNLAPDHIGPGEHDSFKEYLFCKSLLFRHCNIGILNADDGYYNKILDKHTCQVINYGISTKADYQAESYNQFKNDKFLGVQFTENATRETYTVNMPGKFTVYNALAAIAVANTLKIPVEYIQKGLENCVVKGRIELIPISPDYTVLIDFAHNENSAENILLTLRDYKPKRLVVLFGCGGNRSVLRRHGMGEVCSKLADFLILTEDNNRDEDVKDIIADIKTGIQKGNPDVEYVEIPDRLDALHYAIDHAMPGDIIAIIGKGHETYREVKGKKTPFPERELIEEYVANRVN